MMMLGGANAGSTVTFQIFLNENLAGSGWQTNTSRLYIRDSGGRAYGAVFTNTALLDGTFHHLVWTFTTNQVSGSAVLPILDGVPQTLAISTGTPVTFGTLVHPIDFAAYSDKTLNTTIIDYTTATLDEGAFYSYVLTPLQVTNHYLALITASGPAHNDVGPARSTTTGTPPPAIGSIPRRPTRLPTTTMRFLTTRRRNSP